MAYGEPISSTAPGSPSKADPGQAAPLPTLQAALGPGVPRRACGLL